MTSTETPTDLDPRTVFGRAHATARTALAGIGADQFEAPSETSSGAFDIIQKPYSMDGLARTIERAVAHGQPELLAA